MGKDSESFRLELTGKRWQVTADFHLYKIECFQTLDTPLPEG